MVEINQTLQSLYDIESIAEFISRDSEKYAVIQTERFFESVEILTSHPKAGKKYKFLSLNFLIIRVRKTESVSEFTNY